MQFCRLRNFVQIIIVLTLEHTGMAQAQCFSTDIFGCSGTSAGFRSSGQDCCDDGFLAFNAGSDVCEVCPGKIYKIHAWPFSNIDSTLNLHNYVINNRPKRSFIFCLERQWNYLILRPIHPLRFWHCLLLIFIAMDRLIIKFWFFLCSKLMLWPFLDQPLPHPCSKQISLYRAHVIT